MVREIEKSSGAGTNRLRRDRRAVLLPRPAAAREVLIMPREATEERGTIDFQCRVEAEIVGGRGKVIAERRFDQQSVMKTGVVRAWVRKAFNKALGEAGPDVIVSASYRGQMKKAPYSTYAGSLTGVNGQTMRQDGGFSE